jgi:hypothetical protein
MYTIGIDPGKDTGVAVYCTDRQTLIAVHSMSFWEAYRFVQDYDFGVIKEVVVEVPDSKHVWQKAASSPRALQRQGVNVGSVIREAELMAEGLERLGYKVKRVPPRKKIAAAEFIHWTGWSQKTNQHARDAAMLVYRRPRV